MILKLALGALTPDEPCSCGYPCELTRRYYALTWAEADARRHARIERRAFAPIWPFEWTR